MENEAILNMNNLIKIDEENINKYFQEYKKIKKKHKKDSCLSRDDTKKLVLMLNYNKEFYKGEIYDLDLSYLDLSGSNLESMKFINCNFKFSNLKNSYLDAIEFYDCNLDNASFNSSFMECSYFDNCSLKKSAFEKVHLLASVFNDCDLTKSNFSGSNLIEMEGYNLNVTDLIVDDNTAINNGTFENVEWSKTNVSRLNISLDQVKYFFDCIKGIKEIQHFEFDYQKPNFNKIQDNIFKELVNYKSDINETPNHSDVPSNSVFISFASEQKNSIVMPLHKLLKSNYNVWFDEDLDNNSKLKEQIDSEISKCKIAIVILTKEYLVRGWTRYELVKILDRLKKHNCKVVIYSKSIALINLLNKSYLNELDNSQSENIIKVRSINKLESALQYLIP